MLSFSFIENEIQFQVGDQDNEDILKSHIFGWLTGMYEENNPPKDFSELIKYYRLFERIHKKIGETEIKKDRIYKIHLENIVYTLIPEDHISKEPLEIFVQ